jgi:hypothetical protein
MKPADDELLAAYVDGVAELTPEERKRVESKLEKLDAGAVRDVIDRLRALPPEGEEPDWRAMERRIAAAVDESTPWWRRWLVIVPIGVIAAAAAAFVWLHHAPEHDTKPTPIAVIAPDRHDAAVAAPAPAPSETDETDEVLLDGTFVDITNVDADLFDDSDEPPADIADESGLLPAGDLGWVDQLDDRALDRAERWLERKKS